MSKTARVINDTTTIPTTLSASGTATINTQSPSSNIKAFLKKSFASLTVYSPIATCFNCGFLAAAKYTQIPATAFP